MKPAQASMFYSHASALAATYEVMIQVNMPYTTILTTGKIINAVIHHSCSGPRGRSAGRKGGRLLTSYASYAMPYETSHHDAQQRICLTLWTLKISRINRCMADSETQ